MTTEITSQLPPCPLPDCEGGEHHYHDIDAYDVYAVSEGHDCATEARFGFRCYGPHRPGLSEPIDLPEITDEMVERATKTYIGGASGYADPCMRTALDEFRAELVAGVTRWQPIEHDQIRAGMRIRVTVQYDGRATVHVGVAHHRMGSDWSTEQGWLLTGWSYPTIYEVDPATIPDPDAELRRLPDALKKAKAHRDSLAATLIEVQREKLALERAIERVRALHVRGDEWCGYHEDTLCGCFDACCYECEVLYPCPTIQALGGGTEYRQEAVLPDLLARIDAILARSDQACPIENDEPITCGWRRDIQHIREIRATGEQA